VLLVVERLVLAAGAFGLTGRLAVTWAASAGVAVLWAVRGVVRQGVVKEAREKLTMLIAETALVRGTDGGFLPGEEADAAVFEGRNAAEQVIVRHLPPLVAEPVAAVALLYIVKPAAVPVLAGMATVAVAAIFLALLRNAMMTRQRGAWRKYMEVARDTLTSIRAAPELIASGHERMYLERLHKSVGEWTEVAARAERNAALFQRIPLAATVLVAVVLVAQTQGLELSQLIRLGVFLPPIAGLMRTVFELVRTAPRIQTLRAALDEARATRKRAKQDALKKEPPALPCEIRFEAVGFAYGDVQVLKNVSFVWKPGEVLGIKGPNGSGKSTLLKLMLGLLEPTEGRISVGGIDLRDIDLASWRRGIAYLPQRPYLPEKTTVIEAMRLAAPLLGEEEARRGLEEVQIWERLRGARRSGDREMDRLQTPVALLSVGMQQRMMLARVFAQSAGMIVMDEPDENLDNCTRNLLERRLRDLAAAKPMGFATHDGSLMAAAGLIVDLTRPIPFTDNVTDNAP
jgi:ATP-binding cassette subfamily C protein CydCD